MWLFSLLQSLLLLLVLLLQVSIYLVVLSLLMALLWQERTALWVAALHGRTEVVEALLSHGAHVDLARDNEVR